jgi:hypothetical protein
MPELSLVTLGEQLENPDPGRMPQGFEELGFRLVERNAHDATDIWFILR